MPASSNRASWPSSDDNTALSLIVITIGAAFFGWLAWSNFHTAIASAAATLIEWQIGLIGRFTPALTPLAAMVRDADPDKVTIPDIVSVLTVTGSYLRIPAIGFILALAALCFARAAPLRFTRHLDLDGLIREQARSIRPLAAFAHRNLRLTPLEEGHLRPGDPALHVREWAARFASHEDGAFDVNAAARALTAQLGPLWRGVEAAPDPVRFLYAVFALHLHQQRAEAQDLLGALAEALPPGNRQEKTGPMEPYAFPKALAARADALLGAGEPRRRADAIAARHAYTAPVLMALLTAARRRTGVLAPAQFACLKLIDRNLWYALHSLGFEGDGPGQTTHPNPRVEAAGARDHWESERLAGCRLVLPHVARALDAIRASLEQPASSNKVPEAS
jgi:intracellular multiplication protein IcmP